MKEYILDLTNIKSYYYLHKEIKKTFDFPDYYGENLDALWDCTKDYVESPSKIIIIGKDKVPKDMREYVKDMIDVFTDASKLDYKDITINLK